MKGFGKVSKNSGFPKKTIFILLKVLFLVLAVPILIFILFFALEKDYVRAWFWSTIIGIGNLLLIIFSPQQKIKEGIKMLGFFSWAAIIVISLMPLVLVSRETIIINIAQALTLFVSFIGYSVCQIRTMRLFWRR